MQGHYHVPPTHCTPPLTASHNDFRGMAKEGVKTASKITNIPRCGSMGCLFMWNGLCLLLSSRNHAYGSCITYHHHRHLSRKVSPLYAITFGCSERRPNIKPTRERKTKTPFTYKNSTLNYLGSLANKASTNDGCRSSLWLDRSSRCSTLTPSRDRRIRYEFPASWLGVFRKRTENSGRRRLS